MNKKLLFLFFAFTGTTLLAQNYKNVDAPQQRKWTMELWV